MTIDQVLRDLLLAALRLYFSSLFCYWHLIFSLALIAWCVPCIEGSSSRWKLTNQWWQIVPQRERDLPSTHTHTDVYTHRESVCVYIVMASEAFFLLSFLFVCAACRSSFLSIVALRLEVWKSTPDWPHSHETDSSVFLVYTYIGLISILCCVEFQTIYSTPDDKSVSYPS
jgi:hypothetical protein